jgi:hypothetical protein
MVPSVLTRSLAPAVARLAGALVLILAACGAVSSAWAEDIAIIGNARGPLARLGRDDVRALYLGDRQFVGSEKVTVLHLPEGPEKDAFLLGVVGKSAKDYKLHWVQRVFQEGVGFPRVLPDPSAVIAEVESHPASLGYVPVRSIEGARGVVVLLRVPGP